jgi:hypothetical protein
MLMTFFVNKQVACRVIAWFYTRYFPGFVAQSSHGSRTPVGCARVPWFSFTSIVLQTLALMWGMVCSGIPFRRDLSLTQTFGSGFR